MNRQANIAITTEDKDQVEQHYEGEAYGEDVNEKIDYGDVDESPICFIFSNVYSRSGLWRSIMEMSMKRSTRLSSSFPKGSYIQGQVYLPREGM